MRLQNYINESNTDDNHFFWDMFPEEMKAIETECSNIIKAYKNTDQFFYRGLANRKQREILKLIPRIDRIPKDTSVELHDLADYVFNEKFGWKARSEGVFATSSYMAAKAYSKNGTTHIIFPANGFKYIWSPEISDAYEDIFKPIEEGDDEYFFDEWMDKYGWEGGDGIWRRGTRTADSLEDLHNMVDFDDPERSGDTYVSMVRFDNDRGKEWEEEWTWEPRKILSDFIHEQDIKPKLQSYINNNIEKCLKVGNEIMIKCKYYYAIPILDKIKPSQFGL